MLFAQNDDSDNQLDSSLNTLFIELIKDADPDETYHYINMILATMDYDINDFIVYFTDFHSPEDQKEKEAVLIKLLDWFFDSSSEIETVEKALYNSEALDYVIDRMHSFKNSSLWILVIKLAYYIQSDENYRKIDSFITAKRKLWLKGQLLEQDYYPVILSYLRLAKRSGNPVFYYNAEAIYYQDNSPELLKLAKEVMMDILKSSKSN